VRPGEVVAAMADGVAVDCRVLRLGLRAGAGDPLDLDRLRAEARARAATPAADEAAPEPPVAG